MICSTCNPRHPNDLGVYDRLLRTDPANEVGVAVQCIVRGFDMCADNRTNSIYNFMLMGETNGFLTETERTQIRCLYVMGNRVHRILARFAFRWKWSHATRYDVTEDLAGTPITSFPTNQVICLMEHRTLYWFRIADLVRIMDTSMLNVDNDMFANPLPIRNPYTNLQFSTHNLHNVYFAMTMTMMTQPPLSVQLLFREGFDVARTIETWEATFRDLSISAYAKNMDDNICALYIYEMLDKYDMDVVMRFNIADDFPEPVLVETFRSFLRHYLISEYGYNPDQTQRCFAETGVRIFRFRQANPRFGRKIRLHRSVHRSVDEREIIHEKTLCGKDTGWGWYGVGPPTTLPS